MKYNKNPRSFSPHIQEKYNTQSSQASYKRTNISLPFLQNVVSNKKQQGAVQWGQALRDTSAFHTTQVPTLFSVVLPVEYLDSGKFL